MAEKQQTLKGPISVSGIGLHTGSEATLTFVPAPEDHGFVFQRTDLSGKPCIPADVDLVVDTSRGTTLGKDGVRVHTVEHVLAALTGLRVDNALVQLSGPEPPAIDGSSIAFVQAIEQVGLEKQAKDVDIFHVQESISYEEPERGVRLSLEPANHFCGEVIIDFSLDFFPRQKATMQDILQFPRNFADARTFCFLHEVEGLINAGLIKGGNLQSAVVMVDRTLESVEMDRLLKLYGRPSVEIKQGGVLNEGGFRYPNEPARHKLLDFIGDLSLAGKRIAAKFHGLRPGHKANVELARMIKEQIKQTHIT